MRRIFIRAAGEEAATADTPTSSIESAESVSETPAPRASAPAHVEVIHSAGTSHTSAHEDPLGDGEEVCSTLHCGPPQMDHLQRDPILAAEQLKEPGEDDQRWNYEIQPFQRKLQS